MISQAQQVHLSKQKPDQPPRYFLTLVYLCFVIVTGCQALNVQAQVEPETYGASRSPQASTARLGPATEFGDAGQLLWQDSNGLYQAALLLDTHYQVTITGPVARVVVSQRFHNPSSDWREGIYVYPLSETSSIHGLSIATGTQKIIAEIKEKSLAKKIYSEAKNRGKKAALLEQLRDNIFKQSVANIGPGETIEIEVQLQMGVDYNHPTFSLTLPTTITPRFSAQPLLQAGVSSVPSNSTDTQETVSSFNKNTMSINITLDAQLSSGTLSDRDISSDSHNITQQYDGHNYLITTQASDVVMDRDFHLSWSLPAGSDPHSAFYGEQVGSDYYGLLMVSPPSSPVTDISQDVIFIIDTSGSMGGSSIAQAKRALSHAIDQLGPQDYFNIIEFNDDFRALFLQSVPATKNNQAKAQGFVYQLQAGGGTQMLPALMEALTTPQANSQSLRQIVFITDGAVSYETDLFNLIHNQLDDARLFTVAIGAAPNGFFMRKAAQLGRGSFLAIRDQQHIDEQMNRLFDNLNHAVLRDVQIQWPNSVDAWPKQIPDLYHQEPITVAVRFSEANAPTGDVLLQGVYGDGSLWQSAINLATITANANQNSAIARLWAQQKITALLDEIYLGRDRDQVKSAVLPIALQHQLLTPFTSFVAVEERPSRTGGEPLVEEKLALPAPSRVTLAAPQTATASLPLVISGALLLLCAALLRLTQAYPRKA